MNGFRKDLSRGLGRWQLLLQHLPYALPERRVLDLRIIQGDGLVPALVDPDGPALSITGQANLQAEINGFAGPKSKMIRMQDYYHPVIVFCQVFICHWRAPGSFSLRDKQHCRYVTKRQSCRF